ncbi:MAG: Gfo/Idh/MocA family oxidoreductase [Gallintestinimicrobium sp.]
MRGRRRYAQKNNVSLVFDSLEALADSDQIDAVYIASPNFCHAAQSIR